MIEYAPFRAGHLTTLRAQPAQAREWATLVASGGAASLEPHTALSAWDGTRCIGCAGLIPIRPHRAVAWTILGEDAGPHLLTLARKIRRVLRLSPYLRVELTVAEGFENGHRFAAAIGAKLETPEPMIGYGYNGGAEYMYAIVKDK